MGDRVAMGVSKAPLAFLAFPHKPQIMSGPTGILAVRCDYSSLLMATQIKAD